MDRMREMKKIQRPLNVHKSYHAHVYFDEATLVFAIRLCHDAGEKFSLPVGRVHERNVGPHPMWSCQISFGKQHFDELIPWLDKNRQGLTVFVHGVTGDDLKDHTDYAYWLGDSVELKLTIFS
jgi:DOPA 4,5-dioxygenase